MGEHRLAGGARRLAEFLGLDPDEDFSDVARDEDDRLVGQVTAAALRGEGKVLSVRLDAQAHARLQAAAAGAGMDSVSAYVRQLIEDRSSPKSRALENLAVARKLRETADERWARDVAVALLCGAEAHEVAETSGLTVDEVGRLAAQAIPQQRAG